MLTEKAISICLLEILKEISDENHILSMGEIISKINARYGLNPDRRTIYSALETLIELGYDVSLYKDNGKGYYLLDCHLELSEAHLLSDAICTFPFLSERQTAHLMNKIQSLVSVHERKHITMLQADICVMDQQTGFWFQDEKGTLIWDRGLEYLDCEYYREELNGVEKNLRVVSDFLTGKIDLAELLRKYSLGMLQNCLINL